MATLHSARTNIYSLQYHIIFVTKYRRKVLTEEIRNLLIDNMRKTAKDRHVTIEEANGEQDHLHLLIDARPDTDLPNLIKILKGASARAAFKHHPEIKQQLWGGHLWSPSYFIATVSENTEQHIREYIKNQGEVKQDQEHVWEETRKRHRNKYIKQQAQKQG